MVTEWIPFVPTKGFIFIQKYLITYEMLSEKGDKFLNQTQSKQTFIFCSLTLLSNIDFLFFIGKKGDEKRKIS